MKYPNLNDRPFWMLVGHEKYVWMGIVLRDFAWIPPCWHGPETLANPVEWARFLLCGVISGIVGIVAFVALYPVALLGDLGLLVSRKRSALDCANSLVTTGIPFVPVVSVVASIVFAVVHLLGLVVVPLFIAGFLVTTIICEGCLVGITKALGL